MMMESVHSKKIASSIGPFSSAVKAGNFLFLSGQVGLDSTGKLVTGFENEVDQAMKNIGSVLSEVDLNYQDIVTVTIYLKDMKNFQSVNNIYKNYFTQTYPARTCIAVADLPVNANVEVTVTALVKK
jgi:2-iminobutanoate/2-iminopropanoate deaminase